MCYVYVPVLYSIHRNLELSADSQTGTRHERREHYKSMLFYYPHILYLQLVKLHATTWFGLTNSICTCHRLNRKTQWRPKKRIKSGWKIVKIHNLYFEYIGREVTKFEMLWTACHLHVEHFKSNKFVLRYFDNRKLPDERKKIWRKITVCVCMWEIWTVNTEHGSTCSCSSRFFLPLPAELIRFCEHSFCTVRTFVCVSWAISSIPIFWLSFNYSSLYVKCSLDDGWTGGLAYWYLMCGFVNICHSIRFVSKHWYVFRKRVCISTILEPLLSPGITTYISPQKFTFNCVKLFRLLPHFVTFFVVILYWWQC